ncbi:histidine phosphatase family protein [Ascidiimonas sp. W6]|uniref:histidine phosphatase family protein n=1 Tax=Ascidiimonas meishanensis TaxID=3128903 RepID=UPI0030EF6B46
MPKSLKDTEIRIIMSRHGEGLHNVAGKQISAIWKKELQKLRDEITKKHGNTPEINAAFNQLIKEYRDKRDDLAYNLLEKVDPTAYFDPSLTEKGTLQASHSGKVLKAYLDKKQLKISTTAFSSPFARTINSLEGVLDNFKEADQKVFIIPDLMETSGRYVDRFSQDKSYYANYTVLDDEIDVDQVMKGGESDKQVVERTKKGLEKVYKQLKQESDEGIPVVLIHGGIMEKFSNEFFPNKVGKIENSALWDLNISFDENGILLKVDLIEKIEMDETSKQEFDDSLSLLTPSENLLKDQNFGLIEDALSELAHQFNQDIERVISENTLGVDQKKAVLPEKVETQNNSEEDVKVGVATNASSTSFEAFAVLPERLTTERKRANSPMLSANNESSKKQKPARTP